MQTFTVDELETADLVVDAVYQGWRKGGAGDDPLPRLVGVSTGGGFRYRGRLDTLELVVLTSSKKDPDWPDFLDSGTGIYTYYGDNKTPGREIHKTRRFGNLILRQVFENALGGKEGREKIPPILVFSSAGHWRDVVFLGLAVPGVYGPTAGEDLVAIWRSKDGARFQNYRARFTILEAGSVSRSWIKSIIFGKPDSSLAPKAWTTWLETGRALPLIAPRTLEHRTQKEQLPSNSLHLELIETIYEYFRDSPYEFETCAAELVKMMMPDVTTLDLTRKSRDGGRDGIGQYRIGFGPSAISVEFAIEAKCYAIRNSVGVREMSRLISRLRHRQFGVLITTSYVDQQAYREIKDDQHPIVVITSADIADLMIRSGYATKNDVRIWLEHSFPSNSYRVST
jgi:hypothetical protein